EIARALPGRRYEIVAVDDGSTDGSLDVLKALKSRHPELHIVSFASNAGQTAAFAAGFEAARGRVIVTLDADLQNDPADIPAVVAELERSAAAGGLRGGTGAEVRVRHGQRGVGRTKYGMWHCAFRAVADALAVRWMQRRALRYRVREEVP